MVSHEKTLLVTGFPGAGNSRLIAQLSGDIIPAFSMAEADGLETTPDATSRIEAESDHSVGAVIVVADAVNLANVLATEHSGEFARSQIAAADLAVIARADIVDSAPVQEAIAEITSALVIDARELTRETMDQLTPHPRSPAMAAPDATRWSYQGAAQLRGRDIDGILEQRPPGLYRLHGEVRTEDGGFAIEIVGRARETRRIEDPGETYLTALSPGCVVDRRTIELWFTEAVAASTHLICGFSYR